MFSNKLICAYEGNPTKPRHFRKKNQSSVTVNNAVGIDA